MNLLKMIFIFIKAGMGYRQASLDRVEEKPVPTPCGVQLKRFCMRKEANPAGYLVSGDFFHAFSLLPDTTRRP